jgi:hypothetical protein
VYKKLFFLKLCKKIPRIAFWLEVYKRGRVTELTPYGVCFTGYEDTGNPKIVTSPPVGCLEDVRKKLDV